MDPETAGQIKIRSSTNEILETHARTNKAGPPKKRSNQRKLKVKSLVSEIDEYRQNWKYHVEGMVNFRFPKASLHYKTRGRRDPGRPTKIWADQ
jgi:hypothetical protein